MRSRNELSFFSVVWVRGWVTHAAQRDIQVSIESEYVRCVYIMCVHDFGMIVTI